MNSTTQTQHTPGPWTCHDGYRRINSRGSLVVSVGDCPNQEYYSGRYAVEAPHLTAVNENELEANARLIAAAPDMLAELEELLMFARSVRPGGRILESDPDLDAVESLIARARGL